MRVALAYAGTVAESAAIRWLIDRRDAEVVTVTVDFGDGRLLEGIRDRALALGARRAHVVDDRERFADRFVLPAVRAGALGGALPARSAALTDAAIAERLVQVGVIEQADAVAHAGGAASRLDRLLRGQAPPLGVMAVADAWTVDDREREAFRTAHDLPADQRHGDDRGNLWGLLRGPGDRVDVPGASRAAAGDARVMIAFDRGSPVALNGVSLPPHELITTLGTVAAPHGVAAVQALDGAHRAIVDATISHEAGQFASSATRAYERLVEDGEWFRPFRRALDAFFSTLQEPATGSVGLALGQGASRTLDVQLTAASSSAGHP